ncbi:hypothetical protein FHG55_21970 [Pseudomonas jessenii]|uniref:Uncharacterized protein n=1 Tax=Pseudomonas jessenii TaxID=77298 RepID=A0A5C4KTB3_PSEJE|nr:hypothetical protein [Pseudomonas jessenii]TNB92959.1 hypothetical protein FHG55_21970 [Pseudomonas jessenii]
MAGFFSPEQNPRRLDLCGLHASVHFSRINKCIYALTVYASMHILATKPLDKAAGNNSSLVPQEQAAMNRPQRFRGLATDPGVQRKAPRAVIRRAGTAVGKTI